MKDLHQNEQLENFQNALKRQKGDFEIVATLTLTYCAQTFDICDNNLTLNSPILPFSLRGLFPTKGMDPTPPLHPRLY